MTPLEKIEKLLVNPDFPRQELIDYKVDLVINSMIDKYITEDKKNPSNPRFSEYGEEIIDISKGLSIGNNQLQFYCRNKDFDKLFEKIKDSLDRYSPYVGISTKSDPLSQKEQEKNEPENKLCSFGFCVELIITPQMKQVILINQAIDSKLDRKKLKEENRLKNKL